MPFGLMRHVRLFSALGFVTALCIAHTARAQTSIDFPLGVGLHTPSYDRVSGASIPFGPTVNLAGERVAIDAVVTYRSNLGKFDPALSGEWHIDSTFSLSVSGQRGTFSNDKWIRSDIINSLGSLIGGRDSRNYFRADRADARINAHFGVEDQEATFFGGVQFENAWSTGWRPGDGKRWPFSFANRNDTTSGMSRPNPLIDRGHIGSAIFGGRGKYKTGRVVLVNETLLESAWKTPFTGNFTQFTIDQRGSLETFLGQRIAFNAHLVYTGGDSTPRQRFAYLGGTKTLPTLDLLSRGGDRLFWADLSYVIPLKGVNTPVGIPTIEPRFVVGAADIGRFGVPTRQIGARAMLWVLQLDYLVDPKTHRHAVDAGLSFPL